MRIAPAAVSIALFAAVAGCAAQIPPVEVTRFHRLGAGGERFSGSYALTMAPAGAIGADRSGARDQGRDVEISTGDLAWQTYAAAVARQVERVGGTPLSASGAAQPDYLVTLSVDRVQRDSLLAGRSPVSVGVGGGGFGGGGYSGGGVGLGIGINLGGNRDRSQIVTRMAVRIVRRASGDAVWEGRAETSAGKRSPAAQPGIAADKLAQALFRDFPGRSGETISVP